MKFISTYGSEVAKEVITRSLEDYKILIGEQQ